MNETTSTCRALAIACLMAIACGDTDAEPDAGPRPELSARIQRTGFGIPHIVAADEQSLGYGIGYAFAEDAACQLAEEVVTVSGQRSLHFGPDASYQPSGDGRTFINLPSDVFFATLNRDDLVAAAWDRQPADVQALMSGYARGFNRYVDEVGAAGLPESCRSAPWVKPISELDLMKVMRRYAVEASSAQVIDGFYAAQPPSAASLAPAGDPARAADELMRRFRPSLGSNAVALGREATESGAGLLLASPHFPWSGTFRFHQLHVTIPGVVDAFGVTLAGLPAVGIGHNADLAWTHTVNSSRHFALHMLQLDPRDPTRYLVDGESRAMTSSQIAVEVRADDGTVDTVEHTVWSSEWGPIVVLENLPWTPQIAFAFGDANAENTRLMEVWWAIDRARSLEELRAAVEGTLGIPWVNTIAVDAGGTAYLGDVTPVPNITAGLVESCVPEPFRPMAETGLVILDGATSACGWVDSGDTPTPGLTPAAELPVLVRTDFVQNSNDSAWLSNPYDPLTGFPGIVSIDGIEQRARTRLGLQQIEEVLEQGGRFSPALLQELALSNRAFHAGTLLDDLLAVCASAADPELVPPCDTLARWDGTAELASVGWPLFRAWRYAIERAAIDSGESYWAVPFDPADPVGTPRGLRTDDPAVALALLEATAALEAAGMDAERPWGEIQVSTHGGRAIPIHGGGGDDFNDGGDEIYNTINSRPTPDGRLEPFYGSTIVMTVSFEDGGPTAEGFLTYSQSSDPASPHADDQTDRFSRKEWIRYPWTAAAIEGDPALVVNEIEE